MPKKRTHEEFIDEIYNLYGDEYTILSQYINMKTKVNVKHETCNIEYLIYPDSILHGARCRICFNQRKTIEKFKQEVYSLVDSEYSVIGDYVSTHIKLLMRHNICGYEYLVAPSNFLCGKRCPKCSAQKRIQARTKSHEVFKREVYELVGDEYSVISQYINSETKLEIRHNTCKHIYSVKPNNFIMGKRCPECARKNQGAYRKITKKEYIDRVAKVVGDEYNLISSYHNTTTKVTMRHNVCGHEWQITPKNFFKGRRCPICSESIGENKIKKYCEINYYKYKRELSFSDCKNNKKLRFDFALFNKNKLIVLIEYQGEQHYKPIDFAGKGKAWANKSFEKNQKRDQIKRDYCQTKGIKLIEIPYWEENIDMFLDEQLRELSTNIQLSLI